MCSALPATRHLYACIVYSVSAPYSHIYVAGPRDRSSATLPPRQHLKYRIFLFFPSTPPPPLINSRTYISCMSILSTSAQGVARHDFYMVASILSQSSFYFVRKRTSNTQQETAGAHRDMCSVVHLQLPYHHHHHHHPVAGS